MRYLNLARNIAKYNRRNWTVLTSGTARLNYATTTTNHAVRHNENINSKWKVDDRISGFTVRKVEYIDELECNAILLQHDRTSAEYLHVDRHCDSNNAFCVQFRTSPENDTGVTHILEHLVLTGSRRFPVRDPFFKMLNRSLATFMNAMTTPDTTMYPFSSQNESDFRNLMQIYTDAVFNPELDPKNFQVEGWRLEHELVDDQSSPIIFKGIVFNEMKGALSDKETLQFQKLLSHVLPDAYNYNYGGDPNQIPNLTYEMLKHYHQYFYHPSNSKFITYGSFSLEQTLDFLNEEHLRHYQQNSDNGGSENHKSSQNTKVPLQKRWSQKRCETVRVPFDSLMREKPYAMTVALETGDICQLSTNCLLNFISELLLSGLNAPLYKALIEPGRTSGFTSTSGYLDYCRNGLFAVGLQGLQNTESVAEQIAIMDRTLESVLANGFDCDHVAATRHKFELSLSYEGTNKGMRIIQAISNLWNHGADPIEALKQREMYRKIFNELDRNPRLLQSKLDELIITNQHRLELIFEPDENYENKLKEIEQKLLTKKLTELDTVDKKQQVFENGRQLEQHLNANIDYSQILPCLKIDDIARSVDIPAITWLNKEEKQVAYCLAPTNDLVFHCSVLNVKQLPLRQQLLLPLFANFITKLDTNKRSFSQLDTEIAKTNSGLALNVNAIADRNSLDNFTANLQLSHYSLRANFAKSMQLWHEVLEPRKLNAPRGHLENLLELYMADLSQTLISNGHRYAISAASSIISARSLFNEHMAGLEHVRFMRDFIRTASDNVRVLLDEFENILENLTDAKSLFTFANERDIKLLETIPEIVRMSGSTAGSQTENEFEPESSLAGIEQIPCKHHVLSNSQVFYNAKTVRTVPFTHPDYATLVVLSEFVTSEYLHPFIREKQGAYKGAVQFGNGLLQFYSYRDPENRKTLDIFDRCCDWFARKQEITEQQLLEAKLAVFKTVDRPIAAGNRGLNEFVYDLSPEKIDDYRKRLLNVTADSNRLVSVFEKYFACNSAGTAKVVLGPKIDGFVSQPNENWSIKEHL